MTRNITCEKTLMHVQGIYIVFHNSSLIEFDSNCGAHKAVSSFDHNSKVAAHVHQSNHNIDFENVSVVGLEAHYHE